MNRLVLEDRVLFCHTQCGLQARWPAAIGRNGLTSAKREGDGATPVGDFPIRRLFYRPDRVTFKTSCYRTVAIQPDMGWCDDAKAGAIYNRQVALPCSFRHERLWRMDHCYDLLLEIGYNDDPPVAGLGSAIFLHCAAEDFRPTEGCIAIARAHFLTMITMEAPLRRLVICP